jgi:LuxR family transcriptional regulator, quorum-sensing system regulator CciR
MTAMDGMHEIQQFVDASRASTTMEELENHLAAIVRDMGFDFYALMQRLDLRLHDRNTVVALENYPDCFAELFVTSGLYRIDPVLIASERSVAAFEWSQVPSMIDLSSDQRWILETGAREGLSDGYTIPFHVPGEASGSCTFAVRPGRPLPRANLIMARIIGTFAFEAAYSIAQSKRAGDNSRTRTKLTNRQLQCIELVAKGKSDWEIGQILNLKEATVRGHVEDARTKYNVKRRVQLVLRAIQDGHLSWSDAMS